jgi:hypothetical protein
MGRMGSPPLIARGPRNGTADESTGERRSRFGVSQPGRGPDQRLELPPQRARGGRRCLDQDFSGGVPHQSSSSRATAATTNAGGGDLPRSHSQVRLPARMSPAEPLVADAYRALGRQMAALLPVPPPSPLRVCLLAAVEHFRPRGTGRTLSKRRRLLTGRTTGRLVQRRWGGANSSWNRSTSAGLASSAFPGPGPAPYRSALDPGSRLEVAHGERGMMIRADWCRPVSVTAHGQPLTRVRRTSATRRPRLRQAVRWQP